MIERKTNRCLSSLESYIMESSFTTASGQFLKIYDQSEMESEDDFKEGGKSFDVIESVCLFVRLSVFLHSSILIHTFVRRSVYSPDL